MESAQRENDGLICTAGETTELGEKLFGHGSYSPGPVILPALLFGLSFSSPVLSAPAYAAAAALKQQNRYVLQASALCGFRVVRIDPLRFMAGCRKRRLNQA